MRYLAALFLLLPALAQAGTSPFRDGDIATSETATAAVFSSAPVVNVSTISAPGALRIHTGGGVEAIRINSDGGIRFFPRGITDSTIGDFEFVDTGNPAVYFRRNDTTITANDGAGGFYWRDNDSSTGGEDDKAYLQMDYIGTWTNGGTMEQKLKLGMSRGSAAPTDYYVFSSTGLLVQPTGAAADGNVACGTCTIQSVSPSGAGVDIVGNLAVSGATKLSIKTKAQLDALTPVVGDQYLCSDCTVPYDHCVGTGATLSGFRATINSAINTAVPGTLVAKGCGTGN